MHSIYPVTKLGVLGTELARHEGYHIAVVTHSEEHPRPGKFVGYPEDSNTAADHEDATPAFDSVGEVQAWVSKRRAAERTAAKRTLRVPMRVLVEGRRKDGVTPRRFINVVVTGISRTNGDVTFKTEEDLRSYQRPSWEYTFPMTLGDRPEREASVLEALAAKEKAERALYEAKQRSTGKPGRYSYRMGSRQTVEQVNEAIEAFEAKLAEVLG